MPDLHQVQNPHIKGLLHKVEVIVLQQEAVLREAILLLQKAVQATAGVVVEVAAGVQVLQLVLHLQVQVEAVREDVKS